MTNGGNILTLQKVLGHATLTMTMRYAHLAPDHLQEVLNLNPLSTLKLGELAELAQQAAERSAKAIDNSLTFIAASNDHMMKSEKLPVQERVGIPLEESSKGKEKGTKPQS